MTAADVSTLTGPGQTMCFQHPRWREFSDRLSQVAGGCEHDLRMALAILFDMGDIDFNSTLAFFRWHGGFCDCEVVLNIDVDAPRREGADCPPLWFYPRSICRRCAKPYPEMFIAPEDDWEAVIEPAYRDKEVCWECFEPMAAAAGVELSLVRWPHRPMPHKARAAEYRAFADRTRDEEHAAMLRDQADCLERLVEPG